MQIRRRAGPDELYGKTKRRDELKLGKGGKCLVEKVVVGEGGVEGLCCFFQLLVCGLSSDRLLRDSRQLTLTLGKDNAWCSRLG